MPTTIDLLNLAERGEAIFGAQSYAQIGFSVASAGDFNNDGFEDFVFTGPVAGEEDRGRGATYLIFGKAGGIDPIDLDNLPPSQGFAIFGAPVAIFGPNGIDTNAACAGDVNGDGFDDIVIGTPRDGTNGNFSGGAYIVYGHAGDTGPLELATMTAAQGSKVIISPYYHGPSVYGGTDWGPFIGESVASAGDVNNDGFADVIVGATFHSVEGAPQAGAAFLLFGSANGIGNVNLATMTASQGYALLGTEGGGTAGRDVTGLGDVNGDGIDDFAVAIPTYSDGDGKVVVRFGIDGGSFAGGLVPSASKGFVIRGPDFAGYHIAGAGDVNADGYQDILVAQYGGESTTAYLLWGKASFSDIDLTTLGGTPDPDLTPTMPDGIRIDRSATWGTIGNVAGVGDVNADGFDDFAVGIYISQGTVASTDYIVYGSASLNSITLGTSEGLLLRTDELEDYLGMSLGAADLNRDGFSDVLAGAWGSQLAGYYAGAVYAVYGELPTGAVTRSGTVASQTLAGGELDDTLNGLGGDDELYGNGGADTLAGGEGNDKLAGGSGDDELHGGIGNDLIDPGFGSDTVDAGEGNDTVTFRDATYSGPELPFGSIDGGVGYDTVDLRQVPAVVGTLSDGTSFFQGFYVGLQRYSIANVELIQLGGADNYVGLPSGNYAGLEVRGGGGADDMSGTSHLGGSGYRFFGEAGNDRFFISGVFGTATGGLVDGGADVDTLSLNLGFTVDLMLGTAVSGSATFAVSNIENVTAFRDSIVTGSDGANVISVNALFDDPSGAVQFSGGGGDDVVTGSRGHDALTGGAGNDVLDGRAGNDTMTGGLGNDTYYADSAGDVINELAGQGTDTLAVGFSYALAADSAIENLSTIDAAAIVAINLSGNAQANTLVGNVGANVLNGGGGGDILQGLAGNDRYYIGVGDVVVEAAGGGSDIVLTEASFVLGETVFVESLSTRDWAATTTIDLTGNAQANVIVGNAGANKLNGGGGADVLQGFGGNDRYVIDNPGDQVLEAAGGGSDMILTGIDFVLADSVFVESLSARDLAATTALKLTGNAQANTLYGNAGANLLDGGGGADVLQGIGGDDRYVIDNLGDVVLEAAGGGTDTILTGISYVLADTVFVETLSAADAAATSALNLTGNAQANTLHGNAGANVLFGGGGADVLQGLGGDDRYYVDHAGDVVVESAGGGNDILLTEVDYVLAVSAQVESLTTRNQAGTEAIDIRGNDFANAIVGNAGANILGGLGGNDILQGFGGNDLLYGSLGNDRLFGGAGADQFVFDAPLNAASNVDKLEDFVAADDTIVLDRDMFGGIAATGFLAANAFQAGATAADADDRVVYNQATGQLFYDADGSGAGAQVLFATVAPATVLTSADFFVIA